MAPVPSRRRRCLLLAAVFLPLAALGLEPPLDRVLAVVDEDPILASDVEVAIGLSLVSRREGEDDHTFEGRALAELIEQRLRFHQVDRYGFTELPVAQVNLRLADLVANFPSPQAYEERLRELGIREETVRQLIAQRLMVLTYVEERLGARIFVGLEEIKAYYDSVLASEVQRSGAALPPIEEVREQIRAVIKEQRLNQELRTWTEELRREADIVDYFDSVHPELPPVR
jgi:hypothetical protein